MSVNQQAFTEGLLCYKVLLLKKLTAAHHAMTVKPSQRAEDVHSDFIRLQTSVIHKKSSGTHRSDQITLFDPTSMQAF